MSTKRHILAVTGGLLAGALGAGAVQPQSAAPGYVVIEFKVKDAEGFRSYAQQAPQTIAQYGGKFTIRPGKAEVLKGDAPGPFAVVSFGSVEQAKKWASSPEYTALVPLRDKTADTRVFIVEGVAP